MRDGWEVKAGLKGPEPPDECQTLLLSAVGLPWDPAQPALQVARAQRRTTPRPTAVRKKRGRPSHTKSLRNDFRRHVLEIM